MWVFAFAFGVDCNTRVGFNASRYVLRQKSDAQCCQTAQSRPQCLFEFSFVFCPLFPLQSQDIQDSASNSGEFAVQQSGTRICRIRIGERSICFVENDIRQEKNLQECSKVDRGLEDVVKFLLFFSGGIVVGGENSCVLQMLDWTIAGFG